MNPEQLTNPLVEGLVYAPIYKKDAPMKSGRKATGKNPLEESYDRDFGPADVALAIKKNPDLQAVGLYTGIRGKGICILDVDKNLKKLLKGWGNTLENAPVVLSTKKNAAKFIFYVPEHLWGDVKGHGLRKEDGGDYEILWGRRQGVILGAYPGGRQSTPGSYSLEGSLENIPVAPDWLIAEMKAPPKVAVNRKDLDFSDRTEDEVAQIIHDCLSVISHKGAGSRDQWIQVGMAIHSSISTEMGLALWSHWSSQDPDYASEWEEADDNHNPCTTAWYSFKSSGIGLGTLIWLADREDPNRHRFSKETAAIVKEAEEKRVQEIRTTTLDFKEVMKRSKVILSLDNPAERNYKLNALALQAGYRDQLSLEKIIVDQMQYEKHTGVMSVKDLMELDIKRNYLIPDVLPKPSVVLVYGTGGDGKSMSAWALAKHIVSGTPFLVRGKLVPVEQGPVLLLNGDQSLVQLKEQLQEVDYPVDDNTMLQNDWQLQYYAQFIQLMETHRPKLVVVDSLIGCSGGKAFDENKSDFAQPLTWLASNNGVTFPETTILIIHHANKEGGIRGTSAIKAAVDETWELTKPTEEQVSKVGNHSRIIEIKKSRSGREGTQLLMQMQEDLSFTISDFTPEVDKTNTSPASVSDRVLQKLRVVYPDSRSTNELIYDPLLEGKPAAIRKSLQRLLKRGLIETSNEKVESESGKTLQSYKAVLACGGLEDDVSPTSLSSSGTGSDLGQAPGTEGKCPTSPVATSNLGQ